MYKFEFVGIFPCKMFVENMVRRIRKSLNGFGIENMETG